MNAEKKILEKIGSYYTDKVKTHGPSAKGVDWKNEETQEIRFELLSRLFTGAENFEVNDLGCGYGAYAAYLTEAGLPVSNYYGYDISDEMVKQAREQQGHLPNCHFIHSDEPEPRDFTVASGIFNVKLDTTEDAWLQTIDKMLLTMARGSKIGFAFNMLNLPTDEIYRRDHLYYADPHKFEQLCRSKFGSLVETHYHEQLFEFTILVKGLYPKADPSKE